MLLSDYQQYIAKSRYARYLPTENRRETWAETVDRYVSYFGDKYPSTFPIELIRNSIYNLEVMPSMRAVMTAGKALDRDHAAGYNCLSGDTLVTTLEYGIIPIEQLAGISAHVVDGNGDWVLSECSSHGIQKLYRVNFATSDKDSLSVRATGDHRWIKENGEETTTLGLNTGDSLATVQKPGVNDISDCAFGKVIEVIEVIEDGEEEVYCFNVPTTHSFLLTKNLLTGNCAFLVIDDQRAFDEGMYLLLCGTGVGVSVERQFISKLPTIAEEFYESDSVIVVKDSKIGWATALKELISMLFQGIIPKWDLSLIRKAGAPLKVFGGRASGPEPLNELLKYFVATIKNAAGRKLNSLECNDLFCKIGEAVVVGGVRRCLPVNSLIQTTYGLKRIQDITPNSDYVISEGKKAKIIGIVNSGLQKTITIKHQYGKVDVTENHSIAIYDSNREIVFKQAKDITTKDLLVFDVYGTNGQKTYWNGTKVDTHLAWLIGIIHGDGCVEQRTISINAADSDAHMLIKANEIFKTYFGVEGKISQGHGKCKRLRINSKELCDLFHKDIKTPKETIRIPEFIMNSTRENRYAYLAGLFDSDGRTKKDGVFEQTTTIYNEYHKDILDVLYSLGIGSSVYFKDRSSEINKHDSYTINVSGITNRKNWYNGIKLYSLSVKLTRYGEFMFKGSYDFKFYSSMFLERKILGRWKENGYISFDTAKKEGFVNVDEMMRAPSKVQDIIANEDLVDTYDIEVEDINRFTTSGIVVHNSACISLTNLSDDRMRVAKSGQWWNLQPQRALANISVAYTEKPDIGQFMEEWLSLYNSKAGERGIFNRVAAVKKIKQIGRRNPKPIEESGGVNPCLSGDSRVITNIGERTMKELTEMDSLDGIEVLSYDGNKSLFKKLNNAFLTKKNAQLIKINVETSDGNITSLKLTPDHKVMTENRGWVEAAKLTENDILINIHKDLYQNKNINNGKRKANT